MLKADIARYADTDLIAFTNNVNYPGQATSLLGLASYSSTFTNGYGLALGWYPDTNTNAAVNGFNTRQEYLIWFPNPKGSFQCAITMRFCGRLIKGDLWDARYAAIDSYRR